MDEQNEKKYILPFWVYRVVLVILTCIALYLAIGNIISCNPNYSCTGHPFEKKEPYSTEHELYAIYTIDAVDSFLDAEITAYIALYELDYVQEFCELPDEKSEIDSMIESDASRIYNSITLYDMHPSAENYGKVLSLRNTLAKRIDKDERQIQMQ